MRFVVVVCLLSASVPAQGILVRDFAREQAGLWRSPFEKPGRTLKTAGPLAAAITVLMLTDQPTVNRFAQRPAPWARKVSHAGDLSALSGSLAALYGIGRLTHNVTVTEVSERSLKAVTHSFVLTQGLKAMTRRQRPDGSNRWSMPSGHAMTAFSMAGAISAHPRAPRWVKVAAPLTASAIAFSRVGARKHYPSDIAIGSTFGWLIGRAFGRSSSSR